MLTISYTEKMFDSEFRNGGNAEVFRKRLIFPVGLAIEARTAELWILKIDQFKCEKANGRPRIVCYPKVGSRRGELKNLKGCMKCLSYRAQRIHIHDIDLLSGKPSVFRLIHNILKPEKKEIYLYTILFRYQS